MLFWGISIIILTIAMIIASVTGLEAYYHFSIAGAILIISLLTMHHYIMKKPSNRQRLLEKQLEELAEENRRLRAKL